VIAMLIFRPLFDPVSCTYTYLLGDVGDGRAGEAVLIDPVFEHARRDLALLHELGLRLVATLDTHVHADHVTGAWLLQQRLGSRIGVAAVAGAQGADLPLHDGDRIAFGSRHLQVRATPGHTDGCLSYVLDDESMAFTGDSLLIRGCGRTDFQQGSAARLFQSVRQRILSLPPTCLLYPGHDYRGLTVTSVGEELRFNPRLGGNASETDFSGYMAHLSLPHPKLIDIAVPANLRCGRPAGDAPLPEVPGWAPLTFTFSGLWEIEPAALQERLLDANGAAGAVQVVDVREPDEISDALGHIPGARLLPLSALAQQAESLDRSRPVVTVCRSGARSAQAVVLLQKDGFDRLANLAGGMLRWRAEGLPVVGGSGS
jgi:glyoxylase-like metal-dependent hydrolase (beta-lactamase superfamily II)/rhodanese-related sulfurtransferase